MKYNLCFTVLILAIGLFFTTSSCKKDKKVEDTTEQLPPETQTGAYTFGCKVDGEIFTATGRGGLLADQKVNYSYFSSDSTFDITANGTKAKKFNIHLVFKCFTINTPCLLKSPPFEATFYDESNGTIPGNSNSYSTNANNNGSVTIKYFNGTFYPGNFGTIVAGIFEFRAINANGKLIHITDGRFDIGS
jgi:hypothetical protein